MYHFTWYPILSTLILILILILILSLSISLIKFF